MSDVHDKETRSYNMSQIRSKDTKPELLVRRFLHSKGLRYRLHPRNIAGKPDIVLPKFKTVVFIQGCFWHGHKNCPYYVVPRTNKAWWLKKIYSNIERDKKNQKLLQKEGWKVLYFWECKLKSIKSKKNLENLVKKIINNAKFVSKPTCE